MLINCPRCGFSQPNDKYCAQCGVDMETYRPAEKSFSKKLFGNTVVQLAALLIVAVGASVFLYNKDRHDLQSRVEYLKGGVQINSTNGQVSNSAEANSAQLFDGELPEVSAPSPSSADSPEAPGTAAAASTVAAIGEKKPDEAATRTAARTGPIIRVFYAEVNRAALQRMFEESQSTGQFMTFRDDYSAGILPNIDKKLSPSNTNVKILHKEERTLESGKPMQWFYGLKDRIDPEQEIGLTTFVEMSEIESGNYRGNLEIQRSWRESVDGTRTTSLQRRSFPAIFEIGGSTGFFISGVMPYKSNLDSDDELTAIDIYKILKSEEFQRRGSDFVVFVELDQ